jgi:ABC-type dipeptide/oligopeptide/nickel transport system permease subunit
LTEIDHTPDLDSTEVHSADIAQAIEANTDADLTGLGLRDESEGVGGESLSPFRLALRHYKRNRVAMVALIVLLIVMLMCLFPSIPARYGEAQRLPKTASTFIHSPPSAKAWFGTDDLNRDLFSRVFYGGRISIMIGIAVALIACTVGTIVGALAGYLGGVLDDILMRITDIFLAFPLIVSLLVMRNVLNAVSWVKPFVGPTGSIRFLVVLFVVFGWMAVARLVRAQVMSLKEREFVEAARAVGATQSRIVARHIIPNSIGPLLVALSLGVVGAIGAEATLSLFGYGPNPGSGQTSLGLLVAGARESVKGPHWWLSIFPIGVLVLLTLCISFIGDGLRDATDPKSSQGRA